MCKILRRESVRLSKGRENGEAKQFLDQGRGRMLSPLRGEGLVLGRSTRGSGQAGGGNSCEGGGQKAGKKKAVQPVWLEEESSGGGEGR